MKDGHWRADDEESEKAAWEESVRLREQMFWCRIGGGVVPAHSHHPDLSQSPRVSEEERREQEAKLSDELQRTGEIKPRDVTPVIEASSPSVARKRTSKAPARDDTAEGLWQAAQEDAVAPSPADDTEDEASQTNADAPSEQGSSKEHNPSRDSTQSTSSLQVASPGGEGEDGAKRLSITIPGSFEHA